MKIELPLGLIKNAHYAASKHYDERPLNMPIDMIVIHNISLPPGQFGNGYVEKFFCGELDFGLDPYFLTIKNLRVASHLFIDRKGFLTQFVPFSKRAWHAGQSSFQGRTQCNDFSIGIELEGTDDLPFEAAQYQTLNAVIEILIETYPEISPERIVGHSDIAPGRKTDPGEKFDWNSVRTCLKSQKLF